MAINTYGVKTGEFGQCDNVDFRSLSLSVFKNNGGLAKLCNQEVWNMGRKKRTPVKKPGYASLRLNKSPHGTLSRNFTIRIYKRKNFEQVNH